MSFSFWINPTSLQVSCSAVKDNIIFIYRNRNHIQPNKYSMPYYDVDKYRLDLINKSICVMKIQKNIPGFSSDYAYDYSYDYYYFKKFFLDHTSYKKHFNLIQKNNNRKIRQIIKILYEYKICLFTYFIYNKYYNTYSNTKKYLNNFNFIDKLNEIKLFNCRDLYKIYSFI